MMRPRWADRQILRSKINILRAAGRSAQAILRNARAAGPLRPVDSKAKGVHIAVLFILATVVSILQLFIPPSTGLYEK
jgi:hypothetical protein